MDTLPLMSKAEVAEQVMARRRPVGRTAGKRLIISPLAGADPARMLPATSESGLSNRKMCYDYANFTKQMELIREIVANLVAVLGFLHVAA